MVEPDKAGHPCLQQWVEEQVGFPVWPVHRLDRPTSGLVLFSLKKSMVHPLMLQFENRTVTKKYSVLTSFPMDALVHDGTWVHFGVKRPELFRLDVFDEEVPLSQRLELNVEVFPKDSLRATVELKTGRYHQIRAQFAHRHIPILGDVFYSGESWNQEGIALHAGELRFQHPVSKEAMQFSVPSPF